MSQEYLPFAPRIEQEINQDNFSAIYTYRDLSQKVFRELSKLSSELEPRVFLDTADQFFSVIETTLKSINLYKLAAQNTINSTPQLLNETLATLDTNIERIIQSSNNEINQLILEI